MVMTPTPPATLPITRVTRSRLSEVDLTQVSFGAVLADHVFIADCEGTNWEQGRIEPYGPVLHGPAFSALHYGQSIFEGMKAFRGVDGRVRIFRVKDHWARMKRTAERLCMAVVPEALFTTALTELVRTDLEWVPQGDGAALYLRPLLYATDEVVGVRPSQGYRFAVMTSPANKYYPKPIKALAEEEMVRAVEGGVGSAKCAGNYALSMLGGQRAKAKGYDVVVWLDAKERRYLEEFSTMNAFVVIDGVLITPPTQRGTILEGVTRDSVLTLAREMGLKVEVREVGIDEIFTAAKSGRLHEAFGSGTAATIAPIKAIRHRDDEINLPDVAGWQIAPRILERLDAIRYGAAPDTHSWMTLV